MISLKSSLEELNAMNKGTLMESLEIKYTEISEGCVKAAMPVNGRTKQPFGLLHGGASIALAETVASLGSALIVDLSKVDIRGASVATNHVGAVSDGMVYAEGRLIHRGRMTHIWDIDVKDQNGSKVSVTRITVMIVPKMIGKK